jgi:hypothetical protein
MELGPPVLADMPGSVKTFFVFVGFFRSRLSTNQPSREASVYAEATAGQDGVTGGRQWTGRKTNQCHYQLCPLNTRKDAKGFRNPVAAKPFSYR